MSALWSDFSIRIAARFVDTRELCRRAQADESGQRLRILPGSEVTDSNAYLIFA